MLGVDGGRGGRETHREKERQREQKDTQTDSETGNNSAVTNKIISQHSFSTRKLIKMPNEGSVAKAARS